MLWLPARWGGTGWAEQEVDRQTLALLSRGCWQAWRSLDLPCWSCPDQKYGHGAGWGCQTPGLAFMDASLCCGMGRDVVRAMKAERWAGSPCRAEGWSPARICTTAVHGQRDIPAQLSSLTSAEADSCLPDPCSCASQLQHAPRASCSPAPAAEQKEPGAAASPLLCARKGKVDDLLLGLWFTPGLSRVSSLLLVHQTPLVSMPPAQRQVPLLCLRDKVQRLSAFGDWAAESPEVGSSSAFFS